jgi:hypothetical protein
MDIADAQVHVGRGKIDSTLEAMDALAIRSVIIDEYWGTDPGMHFSHIDPGHRLPSGAWSGPPGPSRWKPPSATRIASPSSPA